MPLRIRPLYIFLTAFVILWWTWAFIPSSEGHKSVTQSPLQQVEKNIKSPPFFPIKRDDLLKALQGDIHLAQTFIQQWDISARWIEEQGVPVERLSNTEYLESQLIAHYTSQNNEKELDSLEQSLSENLLVDDIGLSFSSTKKFPKVLPQTVVSASFLLALAPSEQIIALPEIVRKQSELFPTDQIENIPLSSSRLFSEEQYLHKPDFAFVAHYSQPATLSSLKQQGIHLFHLQNFNTLEDIRHSIVKVGASSGHLLKSLVISHLMKAALFAFQNHLNYLKAQNLPVPQNVLYLNHYQNFASPASHTLIGTILSALQIDAITHQIEQVHPGHAWKIPVDNELIHSLDPEVIILADSENENLKQHFLSNSSFSSLRAVKHQQIYSVNETIQESPSQYAVLASFDLYSQLVRAAKTL